MRYRLTMILLVFVGLMTTPAWAATYPITDAFSGSGALSSNWTNTTETSDFNGTLVQASGKAVASPAGTVGLATYTGAGFTNDQVSQTTYLPVTPTGNNNTGPCVRTDTAGDGYCYYPQNGQVWALKAGAPVLNGVPGTVIIHWQVCPVGASGDTVQISAVGTTITCKDVTKGTSASVTDSSITTGNPGIMVDQRGPSGYGLGAFQADCVPSCTYPQTDAFGGSGALSSKWTNTTETSDFNGTLVQASGKAVPSPAGTVGLATYTGAGFTKDQVSQTTYLPVSPTGNNNTGPCVRTDTAGDGYCYYPQNGQVWALKAGAPILNGVPGTVIIHWQVCPVAASGDTVQISAVGTTITCKDVTKGTSASVTDSSITTGNPGIMVDQRGPSGYGLGAFQADCVPSCGGGSPSPAATPTFSPAAGTYTTTLSVTINDTTPSSTIYYTMDGTTPTTASTVYTSPITVSTTETVKAIATAAGYTTSAVGSATYTLNLTVATPTFSPGAGTYTSSQSVTISSSTSGATIYYTTNGTAPTTSSPLYSGPITVSTSETVKALAVKSGYSNSGVGSAAYTIVGKVLAAVAISPQGGAMKSGSTLQFSVVCTYSDHSTDNCASAGGATWSSSALTAMSVSSSGLATWNTDPGAGNIWGYNVVVTAGGLSDNANVYGQHPGDTWYEYPTPQTSSPANNVVVGSTVTMGSAIVDNDPNPGDHTGTPFQGTCNWTSSNTAVATVDRHGQTTAVSPGSVNITCGRAGNAVFGSSTGSGWVSPGDVIALNVVTGGTGNTTWYVLPGGGTVYSSTNTSGQCSGKVNQTYAAAGGTGVNQACGAGNIRYLWADGITYYTENWLISGGDTVMVAQSPAGYNTGLDGPGGSPSWTPVNCAGDSYACFMPTVPSGTAARHTRILGANYASCHADSAKTLLNVSYAAGAEFNVKDSQFVDIACFEVSDKAACGGNGNFTNHCGGSDNFGNNGIFESALTGSVTYTDLFIHGLAGEAIHGATGVGVVANYIHARAMPIAGIDMDDDPWLSGNISVAGGFTLTNSITEWSGCVEEYPVVHNYPYIECRDQNTGGYADGFGTASTTGSWIFDHDTWQYNFQDGLDLLHSGMQELSVTNSLSLGNDGQAYKIGSGDNVIFQNNIAMVNCNRIAYVIGDEPASAIVPGVSTCRAGGDWMVFNFTNLGSYKVQDNTFVGYAATPFDFGCEGGWDFCQNAASTYQNNLFLGYSDPLYNGGALPGLFYEEGSSMPPNQGWATRNHNIFYNTRSGYCPTPLQVGESCTNDPMFVGQPASPISAESDLDGFNFKPSSSSPAIGAGVAIPGITTDYTGATRPNPPSIGAIE